MELHSCRSDTWMAKHLNAVVLSDSFIEDRQIHSTIQLQCINMKTMKI